MEEASRQLIETFASVTEIACNVGYDNPSKFIHVFKKINAETP
ncbi:helix-turn-helix domain-containing protein [Bacillus norwichensis]|uniref:Helix-turn-helix domain-containing protein n=1 Tax=Bacillus norwichensis TaxID=2762217 RepID=A0ABR8VQ32_9BACI|nr:helix-turn-helix domain-containing protein [Bacillus norwichensis]